MTERFLDQIAVLCLELGVVFAILAAGAWLCGKIETLHNEKGERK